MIARIKSHCDVIAISDVRGFLQLQCAVSLVSVKSCTPQSLVNDFSSVTVHLLGLKQVFICLVLEYSPAVAVFGKTVYNISVGNVLIFISVPIVNGSYWQAVNFFFYWTSLFLLSLGETGRTSLRFLFLCDGLHQTPAQTFKVPIARARLSCPPALISIRVRRDPFPL